MVGVFYLQSAYSLFDNLIKLESLFKKAKESDYEFIALSDNNNLYGLVDFFELATKYHIKPVIGIKIDVNYENTETSFLVFAKDDTGFSNLLKLSSMINLQEQTLLFEELLLYQKGLFFITAGISSIIDQLVVKKEFAQARKVIKEFKQLEDFYIGLSLIDIVFEISAASELVKLANEQEVPVLPINKTSYLSKSDKEAYEFLIKVNNSSIESTYLDYSFLNKAELEERFKEYPFVFDNNQEVISKVTFQYPKKEMLLPKFQTPNNLTSHEYLVMSAEAGLLKRIGSLREEYLKRLNYELKIVKETGYDDYFLIVSDFVRWAKENDILVGPGRGSSSGALLSYVLFITEIDPLKYNLMFERFLNPERISMPDIDIDFPDDKRDLVINYVKNKYGINHVAFISTIGTYTEKLVFKDIAKVFGISLDEMNKIVQKIEKNDVREEDYQIKKIIEISQRLDGLPKYIGTHPAGIIFSRNDLNGFIPLTKGPSGFFQSQLESLQLEKMGVLKIDFLALRNLTIINRILKDLQTLKLEDIPLDDPKTFLLLQKADTLGIFQLESPGIRNFLRKLVPTTFEDIIATIALYRPGPMDNLDTYIARRHQEPYKSIHEDLNEILDFTYGIIVYQEQIMSIAAKFANYTLAEGDILRRAISKKDDLALINEQSRFINRTIQNGYSQEIAGAIYNYILKFANYGFNRNHSVPYALLAYQMAYLKAHYPEIFMANLLTNVIGNETLIAEYLNESRKKGITIVKPDINISSHEFVYYQNALYYPLLGIKTLDKALVKSIIEVRKQALFKDFSDFKIRLAQIINERNLESLINSGALDSFKLTHQTMIKNIVLSSVDMSAYIDDFELMEYPEYDFETLAKKEKEALGFNLLYNPFSKYQKLLLKENIIPINEAMHFKDSFKVLGIIKKVKELITKKGDKMAFITITDLTSDLELVVFKEVYQKVELQKNNKIYLFEVYTSKRAEVSYILNKISCLN